MTHLPPLHLLPSRLSKFVASSAMISHRQVKRAWQDGRITVWDAAREVSHVPGIQEHIFPGEDRVCLDGEPLSPREPAAYYVLHKPGGVITTTSDPQGRPCLADWLEELPEGVFPVGRLDKDTTGALLLTDDGDLAHMVLHPEFHVHKLYALTISTRRDPVDEGLRALEEGVDIGDGREPARALSLEHIDTLEGAILVHLTLAEGRNRQIRKMCQSARLYLDHLHRVSFGPLGVQGMAAGECRALSEQEVEALWQSCGGREVPWRRSVAALAHNATQYRERGEPNKRLERWLEAHHSPEEERS